MMSDVAYIDLVRD